MRSKSFFFGSLLLLRASLPSALAEPLEPIYSQSVETKVFFFPYLLKGYGRTELLCGNSRGGAPPAARAAAPPQKHMAQRAAPPPQQHIAQRAAPPQKHMAQMQGNVSAQNAARTAHSGPLQPTSYARSPGAPHSMPIAQHAQFPNTQLSRSLGAKNLPVRQSDQSAGMPAGSRQPFQTNNVTHLAGTGGNSRSHVSPITNASPARLQMAHQLAMHNLQQGHTNGQSPGSNNFSAGRVLAGATAGAALTGLAVHNLTAQQMHRPPSGEGYPVVQNGLHQGLPNNGSVAKPDARQLSRTSSVIIPHEGLNALPGASGTNTAHDLPRGGSGSGGAIGGKDIPPPPRYANPRQVSQHSPAPHYNTGPAGRLSYRQGVSQFPRQGSRQQGIPGIYDPGGYVRTPQKAATRINREYARQQLAIIPNYQREMSTNGRNMVNDRGQWPWRVPQPPTWWNPMSWRSGSRGRNESNKFVGGQSGHGNQDAGSQYGGIQTAGNQYAGNQYPGNQYSGNQYAGNQYSGNQYSGNQYSGNQYSGFGYPGNHYDGNQYVGINPDGGYPYGTNGDGAYWNGWNDYDDWNNWNDQYVNAQPFYGGYNFGPLSFVSNIIGGGGAVGGATNDWLSNLLYFTNYTTGGQTYPAKYFAMNSYAPTPYVFSVDSGQFWQAGVGYADYLPNDDHSPLTVALQEVVPSFDAKEKIVGYQPETFYYDAYWDPDKQSYGYYDYRSKFHWLTFPWLPSYSNQDVAAPPGS